MYVAPAVVVSPPTRRSERVSRPPRMPPESVVQCSASGAQPAQLASPILKAASDSKVVALRSEFVPDRPAAADAVHGVLGGGPRPNPTREIGISSRRRHGRLVGVGRGPLGDRIVCLGHSFPREQTSADSHRKIYACRAEHAGESILELRRYGHFGSPRRKKRHCPPPGACGVACRPRARPPKCARARAAIFTVAPYCESSPSTCEARPRATGRGKTRRSPRSARRRQQTAINPE